MTFALGRRLLHAGVVQPHELRRAIFIAASSDVPFPRALADASPSAAQALSEPIDDGEKPRQRTIHAVRALATRLPEGLCARLMALPVRLDARTGTVDVAVVDPGDAHAIAEIGRHLEAPIRVVVTSLPEMERAIAAFVAGGRGTTHRYPPVTAPQTSESPAHTDPEHPSEDEAPMPLVRRPATSKRAHSKPRHVQPSAAEGSPGTARMFRANADPTPHPHKRDTADLEKPRAAQPAAAPVALVVDFANAARETRDAPTTHRGPPPAPSRAPIAPKLPPYGSLTRVLERLDEVQSRDELLAALVDGLGSFARRAAVFAARKKQFIGVAATGIDADKLRAATIAEAGAVAESVELGERVGVLRSAADGPLLEALELTGAPPTEVVLRPAFVAGKPAMLLAAWGVGDLHEGARRARVLATSVGAALERLLKR